MELGRRHKQTNNSLSSRGGLGVERMTLSWWINPRWGHGTVNICFGKKTLTPTASAKATHMPKKCVF